MRSLTIEALPASVWVKGLRPWNMGDRSPSGCDPNCLNWQENGSVGAETGQTAAALTAGPTHGSTHTRSGRAFKRNVPTARSHEEILSAARRLVECWMTARHH